MSEVETEYAFAGYATVNGKVVEAWKLMTGTTAENCEAYKFVGLVHSAFLGMEGSGFELWARTNTFEAE